MPKITVPVIVTEDAQGIPSVSYGAATDDCPPINGMPSVTYPKNGDIKIQIGPWSDQGKLRIEYEIDKKSGYRFWNHRLKQTKSGGGIDDDGSGNFYQGIVVTNRRLLRFDTKNSTVGSWKLSIEIVKGVFGTPYPFDPEITNSDEYLKGKPWAQSKFGPWKIWKPKGKKLLRRTGG